MKKSVLAMLAAASVLSAVSLNANAATTGNIQFKGSLIDAPCSISADQLNQTVNLGEIPVALVNANGGSKAPTRTFDIKFENCNFDSNSHKQPSFYFSGSADTGDQTKLFTTPDINGGAEHVVLKVNTADGKPVKFSGLDSTTPANNAVQFNILNSGVQSATARFVVSIHNDGTAATAGGYAADTQFTIKYD